MKSVALLVLTTVNAPYGTSLTADELAAKLVIPASDGNSDPSVYAFYSDVSDRLQTAFLAEMAIPFDVASKVAASYSELAGFVLPLARK